VTHHVELVLPGAQYLVRMLDGRIDTKGQVAELRARGVLDDLYHGSSAEVHEEQTSVVEVKAAEEGAAVAIEGESSPTDITKKPRKLIKDEQREVGGVKWSIYKTYLKAS